MINQNIFVYSSKNAIKQKITATQADSGRVLVCNMADITVDASYTARIYAVKPSELKIYNDCTIVGNAVVVDLTTQILAEHGLVKCQIELADGEKKVTSFFFEIDVKETLVDANAIESTDEFTALEKALSEVGDIDAKIALKADLVQGKVPVSQLPSYVDDVLEYENVSAFPSTGESGKIYIALDTNKTYRWGGTGYVVISDSIALGETAETAYRGDRGKIAYDNSLKIGDMSNDELPVPNESVEANIIELNGNLSNKIYDEQNLRLTTLSITFTDGVAEFSPPTIQGITYCFAQFLTASVTVITSTEVLDSQTVALRARRLDNAELYTGTATVTMAFIYAP
ncbi:MAG: BppU family phage baseplate upper protein [Clostridia bacterium]